MNEINNHFKQINEFSRYLAKLKSKPCGIIGKNIQENVQERQNIQGNM